MTCIRFSKQQMVIMVGKYHDDETPADEKEKYLTMLSRCNLSQNAIELIKDPDHHLANPEHAHLSDEALLELAFSLDNSP